MTVFDDYLDHLERSSIPFLGTLVWYSVPDCGEISHAELKALVEQYQAPIRMPGKPKPENVFRRACNGAKRLKVPTSIPNHTLNFKWEDAKHDEHCVYRVCMETTVDGKNHELDARPISKATFHRQGGQVQFDDYIDADDPSYKVLIELQGEIEGFLRDRSDLLPAIAVREAARKAVQITLYGTPVRPGGGVYFVSIDRLDPLKAVRAVIGEIPNCSMHLTPLVDDREQRGMLLSAFEDDSVGQITELVDTMTDLLKSGDDIPARKFEALREQYLSIKSRVEEYRGILDDKLDLSTTALDVCKAQMMKLFEKSE